MNYRLHIRVPEKQLKKCTQLKYAAEVRVSQKSLSAVICFSCSKSNGTKSSLSDSAKLGVSDMAAQQTTVVLITNMV